MTRLDLHGALLIPGIHFMVGIPASGKSTFATLLSRAQHLAVVSPDQIRVSDFGKVYDEADEPKVWKRVHEAIADALVFRHRGLVFDATGASPVHRREMVDFMRARTDSPIHAWWFQTPLRDCLERNAKRKTPVPEDRIKAMRDSLIDHPPTVTEGFASVISVFPGQDEYRFVQRS